MDAIRQELWSHLQIEDSLVFSWAHANRAISPVVFESLKIERQETRRLLAALTYHPAKMTGHKRSPMMLASHEPTLLALAQNLDSHVTGYDAAVLPAILSSVLHG